VAQAVHEEGSGHWRAALRRFVEKPAFHKTVTVLILFNAVVLGLETYKGVMDLYGSALLMADKALLWIFALELALRLTAYGTRFFRDAWNVFDFVVVAIAFLPTGGAFSVLRAARVLRVLRLITAFPQLRRVVRGLLTAIPGIGSIGAILAIVFYVFSVMATKLFGAAYPEWFGTLHGSLFTLFQIMTLEGWADMVRTVQQTHAYAWVFFIIYILLATFTVLNLFIAVVVDAMQKASAADASASEKSQDEALQRIEQELAALHARLDHLKPPA
jgi:voltage-gated sodium channel